MPGADGAAREREIKREARAKLNLYLHITGRRENGFHELASLAAFAKVGDSISVRPAGRLVLEVYGPFAGDLAGTNVQDNLVMRAARCLQDWAEQTGARVAGARIVLHKALPVASGIGGGSADAAAALLALRALWSLPIDDDALASVGVTLGSDLPVCLKGESALMTGIGDVVSAVPSLPLLPIVLVNPNIPVPTPPVYKAFAADHPVIAEAREAPPTGPWTDARDAVLALSAARNDLEPAARALCPAIGDVLAALRQEPDCALARMSGSGATCFGIFPSPADADRAAERLRRAHPDWWVAATAVGGDETGSPA